MKQTIDGLAIGVAVALAVAAGGCGQKAESGGQASAEVAVGKAKTEKRLGTVEERVRACVEEVVGKEIALAGDDDLVKKGKIDSLDSVEIVMAVEEEFGIAIPDEEAEKLRTINEIVAFVKAKGAGAGSGKL